MSGSGYIQVEKIGSGMSEDARASVRAASEKKVVSRNTSLDAGLKSPDEMRYLAASIKRHALDHLSYYLEQAEKKLQENGVQVHWAADAAEARRIIADLCKKENAKVISKSKSMVSEEIELNTHLEELGFQPIETDLGEYVVQLDNDHPSHIVTPIIHINGKKVAQIFEREGLGEYTEDPEELTMQARRRLRQFFEEADVGFTGCNFVVAETGRLVTVSNEGNLRFSSNAPRVHIALTGIEKIVPREEDLAVILKLLARSSTGQNLTVYTQFLSTPKKAGETDGPEEMHLVFLDNGRTKMLGGKYHEMLQCIRCGACLNVCPVYRSVTGHAYGSVYPGPMGAIWSPLLAGDDAKNFSQLPKASSLCAACEEVCPVAIPIPRMLLSLRDDFYDNAPSLKGSPPFGPWKTMATNPSIWRFALGAGKTFGWGVVKIAPVSAFKGWLDKRDLPEWPKESFRTAWKKRKQGGDQ